MVHCNAWLDNSHYHILLCGNDSIQAHTIYQASVAIKYSWYGILDIKHLLSSPAYFLLDFFPYSMVLLFFYFS